MRAASLVMVGSALGPRPRRAAAAGGRVEQQACRARAGRRPGRGGRTGTRCPRRAGRWREVQGAAPDGHVQRRHCLVEDEDAWWGGQCAGDRYVLALAAGQLARKGGYLDEYGPPRPRWERSVSTADGSPCSRPAICLHRVCRSRTSPRRRTGDHGRCRHRTRGDCARLFATAVECPSFVLPVLWPTRPVARVSTRGQ